MNNKNCKIIPTWEKKMGKCIIVILANLHDIYTNKGKTKRIGFKAVFHNCNENLYVRIYNVYINIFGMEIGIFSSAI